MKNISNILNLTGDIDKIIYIIKLLFINMCTYYTFCKMTAEKVGSKKAIIIVLSLSIIVSIICSELKYNFDYLLSILYMIFMESITYTIINKNEYIYNMVGFIISLSINYIIFFISIIIDFFPNMLIINVSNDLINLIVMMTIHFIILYRLFKIKKFKNGFDFLKIGNTNDYFNILILNISITIIFAVIIAKNSNNLVKTYMVSVLILLSIIIYITIKKTLTMYYKHKMLVRELEETKEELEKTKIDRDKLEKENLEFSKTSHSIAHKQKSLEHKLNKLMQNNEIANEIEIRDRIDEISKEYSQNIVQTELPKTGIIEIDDMLDVMKSECVDNKIDFQVQLNGNIYQMINNYVTKNELEILLADHIKDAIIAIKHSDNINRSIFVSLGLIDKCYSLYIYDSGIEFEIDTLINLGTKPITTHKDNGGTGMGFLNTFDTLKNHKASMIIKEIGKPSKDNYTKVIIIKFDGENKFKLNSYRKEEIRKKDIKNNLIIE